MTTALKFRPQTMPKTWTYRAHRGNHLHPRRVQPSSDARARQATEKPVVPLNRVVLGRLFGMCHYLTAHAPAPVRRRHLQMKRRWQQKMRNVRSNLHTWL